MECVGAKQGRFETKRKWENNIVKVTKSVHMRY